MKRVFYNGRKANEYPSQPSSDLRTGTVYEVIGEVASGKQHNFILNGMPSGVGYNSDPVHHQLLEFTQTHVHRISDAIQPSHRLSSPSLPAPNPSQHQSLFQ